tara:strand:+ start:247 stop:483 length:237 start_codon:yes stop_codon:yes gene_type:complete
MLFQEAMKLNVLPKSSDQDLLKSTGTKFQEHNTQSSLETVGLHRTRHNQEESGKLRDGISQLGLMTLWLVHLDFTFLP